LNQPRFVLMDPWLSDAGGHNLQYALDVGGAARERGYAVVLAVHRWLPATTRISPDWQVLRLFRFGVCERHWLGPLGRNRHPCDLDGRRLAEWGQRAGGESRSSGAGRFFSRRWLDWPATLDRRRRIVDFATGCTRLLDRIQARRGDLFFFPSLSEFEFLGVARFLRDDLRTREFDWHLQFHYNLFVGRESEFAGQDERLRRFQQQFQEARRQIPYHRLRFYATTAALARQFNRVGVGPFQRLPYPVRRPGVVQSEGLAGPGESGPCRSPLRATFAGAMRREKGKRRVGTLIAAVWSDCLANGRIQFLFQASPRQVAGWVPRHLRGRVRIAAPDGSDPSAPLCTAGHPLNAEAYAELISRADLGIFLYDSRRYYARASGILCEMLAAGIPVIVPAGCWLSDQITIEHHRHVASLSSCSDLVLGVLHPDIARRSLDQVVSCRVPAAARDLAVRWEWPPEASAGVYVELTAEFTGGACGDAPVRWRGITGAPDEGLAGLIVPIPRAAQQVCLSFRSAYGHPLGDIGRVTVTLLSPPPGCEHHPSGRVGLIAADEQQVPDLLRDAIAHYPHYRSSARDFSRTWLERHDPHRTLESLESRSLEKELEAC
jgi:hypothetical protein